MLGVLGVVAVAIVVVYGSVCEIWRGLGQASVGWTVLFPDHTLSPLDAV